MRNDYDIGFYTFITNYMVREGYAKSAFSSEKFSLFDHIETKMTKLTKLLDKIDQKKHPYLCVNDGLKGEPILVKKAMDYFEQRMGEVYPIKTPFEI